MFFHNTADTYETDFSCWVYWEFFFCENSSLKNHSEAWCTVAMNITHLVWYTDIFNPLNTELNPICYLLALLGAHHFPHVSRIRVKSLTLRLLTSYIYIYLEHQFLMFLDHTRRSTVGGTPLDEWSARRRDLYLTTHDTHNRQISMPPVGFEPKISAGERPCPIVYHISYVIYHIISYHHTISYHISYIISFVIYHIIYTISYINSNLPSSRLGVREDTRSSSVLIYRWIPRILKWVITCSFQILPSTVHLHIQFDAV